MRIVLIVLFIVGGLAIASRPTEATEAMEKLAQHGQFGEIVGRCNSAIRANPHDAPAYALRGWANMRQLGQEEQGIEDCNRALELDPNYAPAYRYRAEGYSKLGQFQKCDEDLKTAINLKPVNDPDAFYLRSWAHCELGDYQKAVADLNTEINLNPKDACAYDERGWVYEYLNDYQREIADYSAAIRLNPKNAYFYVDRGHAYGTLHQYQKAIEDLNTAARLAPRDALLPRLNLAWTYWQMGQKDLGSKIAEATMRIDPKRCDVCTDWSSLHQTLAYYRRSIYSWDRAISMTPSKLESVSAYCNRGWAHEWLGEDKLAIADFSTAISFADPDRDVWKANLYEKRAEVQKHFGHYKDAVLDRIIATALAAPSWTVRLALSLLALVMMLTMRRKISPQVA